MRDDKKPAAEVPAGAEKDNRHDLRKALESRHVAMISIGGIIGSGLFIQSSAAIAATGPVIIVSYVLAGILVLCVMQMLAEMAATSPEIGSFTEYVRLGLGNVAGFVSGWLYWYFWVLALALEALSGAAILRTWIDVPLWQTGLVLLMMLTGLNLLSTRAFGEAEFWLSSIKVAALAAFIMIGGAYLMGLVGEGAAPTRQLLGHGGFAPLGIGAMFAGITTVVFSLVGAEIVTVAAAESREPARAIARLTTTLVVRLALFFVASMIVILAVVPWNEISPGTSPFGMALDRMGIPAAAHIMNFVILVAVLSCLNAGFYVSSRVLFALAGKGDAPRWMVELNSRGVPVRSVIVGSLIACGGLFGAMFFPEAIFSFLVNASGVVMLLIYAMLGAAQIRRRKALERSAPQRLRFRVRWFPLSSYAVLGAILAVLASMGLQSELRSQLWSGLALTGLVLLIAVRHYRKRRRGAELPSRASAG